MLLSGHFSVDPNRCVSKLIWIKGNRNGSRASFYQTKSPQARNGFFSMAWWIDAPLPLKLLYFAIAWILFFALIARIADVEFGRNAEKQVVDFAEGLTEVLLILFVPALLSGLIMFLVYSAQCSQEGAETAQDQ